MLRHDGPEELESGAHRSLRSVSRTSTVDPQRVPFVGS
jgi:hypothetical protein